MSKDQTRAEELLNELRIIPKIIKTLAEDSEAIRGALLTAPQWSDMRVTGGLRQSQEDKNIKVIDKTEYHQAEIDKLIKRREEITSIIMQLPMIQAHILNVTYLKCDNYDEAMDYLDIRNRNKYFRAGSFKADIILFTQTYILPLVPVVGEHGDLVWECVLNSFNFVKTIAKAKKEGKSVDISNIGDKAIVIINNGNDVTINQEFPLNKNREERIVRMKKR